MKEYRFIFEGEKSNLYNLKRRAPKHVSMHIRYKKGKTFLTVMGEISEYVNLYLYCKKEAIKAYIIEQIECW